MTTRVIEVTYKYTLKFEHEDHLKDMLRELRNAPKYETSGAGVASDGRVHGYSLKLKGKGKIKS